GRCEISPPATPRRLLCYLTAVCTYVMEWTLERGTRFESTLKRLIKKRRNECVNALDNLAKYTQALNEGAKPAQISLLGFVHNEREGAYAVDQTGKLKSNAPVRLYVYPDEADHVLHVIQIGDKSSQKRDVNEVHDYVRKIRAEQSKREENE
ncbi:MAG: hypothetical protein O2945_23485, partial [Planctomycetota bacterium]|nr:hypothetical protein [Planctomycetota bacterium]